MEMFGGKNLSYSIVMSQIGGSSPQNYRFYHSSEDTQECTQLMSQSAQVLQKQSGCGCGQKVGLSLSGKACLSGEAWPRNRTDERGVLERLQSTESKARQECQGGS